MAGKKSQPSTGGDFPISVGDQVKAWSVKESENVDAHHQAE